MPRSYELTLILDSQLQEDGVEEAVTRYQDLLSGQGAAVLSVDRWGMRKLAYEIRKHQQGVFALVQFQGEPDVLKELDRVCRLDESVLRHMVIQVEEGFAPEAEPEEAADDGPDDDDEDEDAIDPEDDAEGEDEE